MSASTKGGAAAAASHNGTTAPEKCSYCKGEIQIVGNGRTGPIKRCRSCGRSPDEAPPVSAPDNRVASMGAAAGVRAGQSCRVDGCPGTLDGSGRCPCCAKRTAWEAEHMPKRHCAICGGTIRGRLSQKYCPACKPIAQKVQIAKAGNAASGRPKS